MTCKCLATLVLVVAAAFFVATSAGAAPDHVPPYSCTTNNSTLLSGLPLPTVNVKGVMAGCIRGTLKISAQIMVDGMFAWGSGDITCLNATSCSIPSTVVPVDRACQCHSLITVIVKGQHDGGQDDEEKSWQL